MRIADIPPLPNTSVTTTTADVAPGAISGNAPVIAIVVAAVILVFALLAFLYLHSRRS